MTVYIAGPMTGHPFYNFPAFDECRDALISWGYDVISPADLERAVGFDPETSVVDKKFLDEAMQRDIEAIMKVDMMVMLPGWRDSTGATAEYHLAKWRHIEICEWPHLNKIDKVDPKAEAGSKKCPLQLLPVVALEHIAWVQKLGADKYGPNNWRNTYIELATYQGAIMRHLFAIANGEWLDPESGRPHAAHIAASCNILIDADHHNTLNK